MARRRGPWRLGLHRTPQRDADGEPVEEISLEEARQIAARVGEPAPF